ncbi:DASH family cryptochrome [Alkalinema sp. FACHB-956]|uniref:DASH family cryptochrome n=1 Tax=Alkalinema sp. FACHB-956 TaxID=2692768 RepID=UPI0016895E80|nr:DASH family cryptochrome [Alkalinema sp. FACHB-956]MBD2326137.1 DASH family cryptochrome [Alkalinema sp. FACHB-956]
MARQAVILWFRNDLRIHDHGLLSQAAQSGAVVIPVYCFDLRQFGTTSFGFPKTGPWRSQFLLQSVADLRRSLQTLGSDLILRVGYPEVEIPKLVQQLLSSAEDGLEIQAVAFHQEVTAEELQVEQGLQRSLKALNIPVQTAWGATLYHPDDLPFAMPDLPELFTTFRKQVEKAATIRPCAPTPNTLPTLPAQIDRGDLPTLETLGVTRPTADPRCQFQFTGGATAGINRVQAYIWQRDRLRIYKETRNGMLDPDDSSKFSPWLALGCLSPRYLYEQVAQYETQRIRNDSTYWLIFELLWRDYFRWVCAKHGDRVFYRDGLRGVSFPWKQDWPRFEQWQAGQTGYPLVDANMQELAATGFMSNRGRQNVASFLTKNLGIDWRMGAEYFESQLIDYDVCSNWGNWNYAAGVGNDARGFRFFNITKQAKDYDPQGKYVKHWLPCLAKLPVNQVHEPWKLGNAEQKPNAEQKQWGIRVGVDYPHPIVDLFKSATANEQRYEAAFPPKTGYFPKKDKNLPKQEIHRSETAPIIRP